VNGKGEKRRERIEALLLSDGVGKWKWEIIEGKRERMGMGMGRKKVFSAPGRSTVRHLEATSSCHIRVCVCRSVS